MSNFHYYYYYGRHYFIQSLYLLLIVIIHCCYASLFLPLSLHEVFAQFSFYFFLIYFVRFISTVLMACPPACPWN